MLGRDILTTCRVVNHDSRDGSTLAFVGTVQYTEKSQGDSLDKVQTRATLLRLADWVFPIAGLTPKDMAVDIGVPFHKGAAKYYKEKGAL